MNDRSPSGGGLPRIVVWFGGGALLLAALVDAAAVIGRHVGEPVLGAIELVEALVLIAASVAMVAATLAKSHAVIHLLLDRLPPGTREVVVGFHRIVSALFFIALVAGSIWVAADMWSGYEESELLRLPYRPLRIFSVVSLATVALLFLFQAVGRDRT